MLTGVVNPRETQSFLSDGRGVDEGLGGYGGRGLDGLGGVGGYVGGCGWSDPSVTPQRNPYRVTIHFGGGGGLSCFPNPSVLGTVYVRAKPSDRACDDRPSQWPSRAAALWRAIVSMKRVKAESSRTAYAHVTSDKIHVTCDSQVRKLTDSLLCTCDK